VWFGMQNASTVGYVTPAGVVQTFGTNGGISYMCLGSDGNIWFTEFSINKIGRITPAGVFTDFGGLTGPQPDGIALGPNGDAFFAEFGAGSPGRVGQITTAGVVTESAQLAGPPQIQSVALGSDNRLWITEPFSLGTLYLDAMTPSFAFTRYTIPGGAVLRDLTNGPDNNLWIVDSGNNKIDQVSTSGVFLNQYPAPGSGAYGMATGSDGKLYFAEYTTNDIASMTTGGATTTYPIPTSNAGANGVTKGPDGNIWFPEANGGQIGRLIL